jgi:hypothetical protein
MSETAAAIRSGEWAARPFREWTENGPRGSLNRGARQGAMGEGYQPPMTTETPVIKLALATEGRVTV